MKIELIHGDCLELMKGIPDGSIDLIVTDPPYKTITGGNKDGANSVRPKGILSNNKQIFRHQRDSDMVCWMAEVFRALKSGANCYIFCNSLNLKDMIACAQSVGFMLHNVLVWEKNNCTPSQYYMKNCEYVLFLRKGKAKYINNIGASKTVHKFDNVRHKRHPAEKPVDLLEFYITNSSTEGDTILDLFMGSGSTGVACINTNRNFVGIELDDDYFEIARKRIEDAKATKEQEETND